MESLDKQQCEKILTSGVRRIFDALHTVGEARIVGGAVRDVLLGRKVGDIDLAANIPPEKMMEVLEKEGIKTVPTGLAHGTITAVVDHVGYEITTLRRDVETDGRHAQIAFTGDWEEDAGRRDFTFNALYVDANGKIYDYFGGIEDAKAGRVRFIGDARDRIREDVLRILRFFRFYAWFGSTEIDVKGLAACQELVDLIPRLSAERVAREILKLLAAENPLAAWRLMIASRATQAFIAEATDIDRLQVLLENERKQKERQTSLTRLAALSPQSKDVATQISTRLKLSNRDSETLYALAILPNLLRSPFERSELRRVIYEHGPENCRAALFLVDGDISQALATLAAWENPVFPLKGEDIVKLGLSAGPRVGEALKQIEQEWVKSDFHIDRDTCLVCAKEYIKSL